MIRINVSTASTSVVPISTIAFYDTYTVMCADRAGQAIRDNPTIVRNSARDAF